MEPVQQRRFDRRAFIMGTELAATGQAIDDTPLAFAVEGDSIPSVGSGRMRRLDPDQTGDAAWLRPAAAAAAASTTGAIESTVLKAAGG